MHSQGGGVNVAVLCTTAKSTVGGWARKSVKTVSTNCKKTGLVQTRTK